MEEYRGSKLSNNCFKKRKMETIITLLAAFTDKDEEIEEWLSSPQDTKRKFYTA